MVVKSIAGLGIIINAKESNSKRVFPPKFSFRRQLKRNRRVNSFCNIRKANSRCLSLNFMDGIKGVNLKKPFKYFSIFPTKKLELNIRGVFLIKWAIFKNVAQRETIFLNVCQI